MSFSDAFRTGSIAAGFPPPATNLICCYRPAKRTSVAAIVERDQARFLLIPSRGLEEPIYRRDKGMGESKREEAFLNL